MLNQKLSFLVPLIIFIKVIEVRSQSANFTQLKFVFINNNNPTANQNYTLDNLVSILYNPKFRLTRRTIFYIFGFTETISSSSTQKIIKAYASLKNVNLIALDWSEYNNYNKNMPKAILAAQGVGKVVGEKLKKTFGLLLRDFELVGYSLGAHLAAYINRAVGNGPIRVLKIIALDPSGPYMNLTTSLPLNPSDANVVVAIHTHSWYAGTTMKTGTVDFWPNGGYNQTGCPPMNLEVLLTDSNFCSHRRVIDLFIESLLSSDKNTFAAVQCENYVAFVLDRCAKDKKLTNFTPKLIMTADERKNSNFFFQTNSKEPFSRGLDGIKYDANLF